MGLRAENPALNFGNRLAGPVSGMAGNEGRDSRRDESFFDATEPLTRSDQSPWWISLGAEDLLNILRNSKGLAPVFLLGLAMAFAVRHSTLDTDGHAFFEAPETISTFVIVGGRFGQGRVESDLCDVFPVFPWAERGITRHSAHGTEGL